jgi:uncharacterized paraquat-inducible protein A
MKVVDDNDIVICTECDAEFTVHKLDDEDGDVEFCPYCGHHLWEDQREDEDDDGYFDD